MDTSNQMSTQYNVRTCSLIKDHVWVSPGMSVQTVHTGPYAKSVHPQIQYTSRRGPKLCRTLKVCPWASRSWLLEESPIAKENSRWDLLYITFPSPRQNWALVKTKDRFCAFFRVMQAGGVIVLLNMSKAQCDTQKPSLLVCSCVLMLVVSYVQCFLDSRPARQFSWAKLYNTDGLDTATITVSPSCFTQKSTVNGSKVGSTTLCCVSRC